MNLEGKYTIIDLNNINTVIAFLYREGYNWANNDINLNDTIRELKEIIEKSNEIIYIKLRSNKKFWFTIDIPQKLTYFDINKLLREYKLKRILK